MATPLPVGVGTVLPNVRTDRETLPELASEMSNVSKACRIMGYSRQQFYEIRRTYQTFGADGLIDRLPGARGPHPNRVSEDVEAAILAHALDPPTHGALRVAQELMLKGVQVSSGGVRGVWSRHSLLTKQERLLRLEKTTAERRIELSDEQIRLLERFSPEFRERHISRPGIPATWSPSTPSSSVTSRASERSTCRPSSTATADTPGDASTPTSCRSPPCTS